MRYVDGFLLPVPKRNLAAYRRISTKAGKVWRRYGALEYVEAVGDDFSMGMGVSFKKAARSRPSEVVLFSFIVYRSRRHRDAVNKKVMKDPYMLRMMNDPKAMPFDARRMAYGGFKTIVDL
jgi:uncharacterized protein YbaA (DUF1428 family)